MKRSRVCENSSLMLLAEAAEAVAEEEELILFFEKKSEMAENANAEEPVFPRILILGFEAHLGRIEGGHTNPIWLGSKALTKSDTERHLNRLFIPGQIIERLKPHLNAGEKNDTEPSGSPGIVVRLMDPAMCHCEVRFKRWESLSQFVFAEGWNRVVQANTFKPGDKIYLWAFRHGQHNKLGFIASNSIMIH